MGRSARGGLFFIGNCFAIPHLKGVLILLVVIGHFLLPMEQTRLVWCLFYLIYLFHMPMFIMISGYFAKGVYEDGICRWEKVLWILQYIVYGMNYQGLHESAADWGA